MNTLLLEKIAVWTIFFTVLAVVIGMTYATVHLVRDTATTEEMNVRFDKIDNRLDSIESHLDLIRKELSNVNVKVSDNMVNHLSTAHVGKP